MPCAPLTRETSARRRLHYANKAAHQISARGARSGAATRKPRASHNHGAARAGHSSAGARDGRGGEERVFGVVRGPERKSTRVRRSRICKASTLPFRRRKNRRKRPSARRYAERHANEYKIRGNEKFKQRDYPGAVAAYSEAIALDPNNSVLRDRRAGVPVSSRAPEEGVSCEEGIAATPRRRRRGPRAVFPSRPGLQKRASLRRRGAATPP